MNAAHDKELRLMAEDEEDLRVLSAYLQDALVRVGDLAYLPKTRRFALLASRFCWECDGEGGSAALRKPTGLHFDNVRNVKAINVNQSQPESLLQLLAIQPAEAEGGFGVIDLCFAGGGRIRLGVESIDAVLRDLGEAWPTRSRPVHDLGEV
jgi:hypothetical protein